MPSNHEPIFDPPLVNVDSPEPTLQEDPEHASRELCKRPSFESSALDPHLFECRGGQSA